MSDRIRLAEAIHGPCVDDCDDESYMVGCPIHDESEWNPLKNANDDYAVLEWMRKDGPNEAMDHFLFWHPQDYQVGDYARAALKVLENDK